jgi:predicted nucleic acid-binding protein
LEYFAAGPNAERFDAVIHSVEELVVPTIVVYEVCKVALRDSGDNAVIQVCTAMQKGMIVSLSPNLAIAASRLSLRHGLPMADAIILATAQDHKATLWTQDAHFKGLAGVEYFPKR